MEQLMLIMLQMKQITIKSIDPRAAEGNTMWDEVSWDIANGDWQ